MYRCGCARCWIFLSSTFTSNKRRAPILGVEVRFVSSQAISIGVDLGTSSTRAVALDAQGNLRGAARVGGVPPGLRAGPGIGFDALFESALTAIAQALAEAGSTPGQVAGIAVCGQMAGLCAVDARGQALGPSDSWLDLDCASTLDLLRPHEHGIIQRSGSQLIAGHGAKWLQMRDQQPARYRQVCKLTTPSALVALQLAGLDGSEAFFDTTHLGFNNFADTPTAGWNLALVRALGLDADHLPRIVEPWERIGGLSRACAERLGLLAGTPVHAGCGDIAATLLGSGAVEDGQLVDIAGTGSVLCAVRRDFTVDHSHKTLLTLRHCLPDLYYSAAYVGGGGLNLDWLASLREQVRPPHEVSAALREHGAVPPLLFAPHMGGRHLPLAADRRGAFVGLSWQHSLADLQRAVIEATAYEYAGFLDAMLATGVCSGEGAVLVVGGGAASEACSQIKADVLGLPYRRHGVFEAAALGAALLAGYGAGTFSDLREAALRAARAPGGRVRPDPARHGLYRQRRQVQARMLVALAPVFAELAQLPRM